MGRELLGAANVGDGQLAAMVADVLGAETVTLLDVNVDPVDYDLPAITTAGRWWVSGRADTPFGEAPFRVFVKQVHNWSRSPQFAFVPPDLQEAAAASVPWRTEPNIYRSDLSNRLPDGLSMPRVLAVVDLDELSSAVWLEEVPLREWPWDIERFAACGVPAGPARRQRACRSAGSDRRPPVDGARLPARPVRPPGRPDASR